MYVFRGSNKKNAILVVAGTALVAAIILLALHWWPRAVIPEAISAQAPFTIFVPDSEIVAIDEDSVRYETSEKLVTYSVVIAGIRAVVSQQQTPEQFIDIPQTYEKLLDNFRQYKKFEVSSGVVYLARPVNLQGRQAAIMNSKGTLMFVKPVQDLTEDQWRVFFKGLRAEI